ncbi:MAG: hypothetical protein AABX16_00040 [Nanoarchaeota archaeon]
MTSDYIVYKDEEGEYGYAPRSFYKGAENFLEFVIIINKESLLETQARILSARLNG